MSRKKARLSLDVRTLLERERLIPPLTSSARARALARARSTLAAGVVELPAPSRVAPGKIRWVAAAALVCVASTAAATVAYELAMRARPVVPTAMEQTLPPPAELVASNRATARSTDLDPSTARSAWVRRIDGAREELRLLSRARADVARQDFLAALSPLAEHARRFKNGRLAEEREALQVKALAGLGRMDDARRTAAAFESRFPRSVLLPAVRQLSATTL